MIHPSREVTANPDSSFRRVYIDFRVTLIQRVRDIPNDQFGIIYLSDNQMHEIHTTIKAAIQTSVALLALKVYAKKEFSITRQFSHIITQLDPIHLYPGDFLTASSRNDDKIAGYKTYSEFRSPSFWPLNNPLSC